MRAPGRLKRVQYRQDVFHGGGENTNSYKSIVDNTMNTNTMIITLITSSSSSSSHSRHKDGKGVRDTSQLVSVLDSLFSNCCPGFSCKSSIVIDVLESVASSFGQVSHGFLVFSVHGLVAKQPVPSLRL